MHKVCDYNFQIHRRNGQRAIPRRAMSVMGDLNLGLIAQQLNQILGDVVVYPNIRNMFSLLCVEHQNGMSSGWCKINIDIPGTVVRFHFVLDRDLNVLGQPTIQDGYRRNGTVVSRKLVRQHVTFSNLSPLIGGGRIMTIGFSAKELGINHEALRRTLDDAELMYKILGMSTKAFKLYEGKVFHDSEHLGTVLANNSPDEYYKCVSIWKRYPNLIPILNLRQAEYALEHVQKYRKLRDTGNRAISLAQRSILGVIPTGYYEGLINWVYLAVRERANNLPATDNKCLEICFNNFNSNAESVEELALQLWSHDEVTTKHRIHTFIWSSHERN